MNIFNRTAPSRTSNEFRLLAGVLLVFLALPLALLIYSTASRPVLPTPPRQVSPPLNKPSAEAVALAEFTAWRTNYLQQLGDRKPTDGQRYVLEHYTTPQTRASILEGSIAIGMSLVEVEASWGTPDRRTHTQFENGTSDIWTYRSRNIYFTQGRVQVIQDSAAGPP